MKCLFLPLLGSLLSFLLIIPVGRDSAFPLLTVRFTLFVNDLRSSISPSSPLRPLFSGTLSAQSNLMGRCRESFFSRAREKCSRQDRSGIDGAKVHKALEDGTKRRYKGAIRLWIKYVLCSYSLHRFPAPLPHLRPALLMLPSLTRPFNRYSAEYEKDPNNDAYNLETLKDFIQEVGPCRVEP
jgi:hypothetical protein